MNPAINGWAIFRGGGARPKTAIGTGALPGKVPVGGRAQVMAIRKDPRAVWGGRTGQRAVEFLSREGREGGEVRRTGIFVEPAMQMNQAP